jgi:hypothetical protein
MLLCFLAVGVSDKFLARVMFIWDNEIRKKHLYSGTDEP